MKNNSEVPSPTVLLGQQGYERALVRSRLLKPKHLISIFEHRRNRGRLIGSLLRIFWIVTKEGLQGKRASIVISSCEADEVLALLWLGLDMLKLRADFWLLKTNDREARFEPADEGEVAMTSRTRAVLRRLAQRFPGAVTYKRNDIGQANYFLDIPIARRILLPIGESQDYADVQVARLFLLLEPERSDDIIDKTKWIDRMSEIAFQAKHAFPGIRILQKSHPYQACWSLDIQESETLPHDTNIFDHLKKDDWVVGTFSNVIDISPQICRTTSIFNQVATAKAPESIHDRVRNSGAEIA